MDKYNKKKDNIVDKTFVIFSSFIILVIFSIVSAIISLMLPDIIYLYGIVPLSLTYFVFGIFLMLWSFLTVFFVKMFGIRKRK